VKEGRRVGKKKGREKGKGRKREDPLDLLPFPGKMS